MVNLGFLLIDGSGVDNLPAIMACNSEAKIMLMSGNSGGLIDPALIERYRIEVLDKPLNLEDLLLRFRDD